MRPLRICSLPLQGLTRYQTVELAQRTSALQAAEFRLRVGRVSSPPWEADIGAAFQRRLFRL
jgi:hypothetical protein